jgi:NTP pyrophosphatase (non-canonical NTP hydrolase)
MTNFQPLQEEIAQWSDKTFGSDPDREIAIARHLIEEAQELFDAVSIERSNTPQPGAIYNVKGQIADCFILLLDLAAKYNISMHNVYFIIEDKMETNRKRQWEKDENGLYHHI